MNRKSFFHAFIPASLGTMLINKSFANPATHPAVANIPPYLKRGDTIGITCPAGPIEIGNIQPCCRALKKWGLNVRYGNTVGKQWLRFGGTDKERLEDFQSLLDDDNINAILFGKGGYGTMRIIDKLNWEKFKRKPKWLVGYSDLTTVHLHVHANLGIPTIHGDMGNGFSDDYDASSSSLYNVLYGHKVKYNIKGSRLNRLGTAQGTLVGGNLTLLQACAGSKSDIKTEGKILFIEDVSEYKYSIDRMMMSLKRGGKLDKLAGLIVGGFTSTKSEEEESFQVSVEEIVWDKVKDYTYPVCFHFPAGHIKDNRALKMGVAYEFCVSQNDVSLVENSSAPDPVFLTDDLKIGNDSLYNFSDTMFAAPPRLPFPQ